MSTLALHTQNHPTPAVAPPLAERWLPTELLDLSELTLEVVEQPDNPSDLAGGGAAAVGYEPEETLGSSSPPPAAACTLRLVGRRASRGSQGEAVWVRANLVLASAEQASHFRRLVHETQAGHGMQQEGAGLRAKACLEQLSVSRIVRRDAHPELESVLL